MNVTTMMREIASSGGSIEVVEGHYAPHDDEALRLGLITKEPSGGGWDVHEVIRLTNNGNRHLGIDVITPAPTRSILTRIRALFGRPSRKPI